MLNNIRMESILLLLLLQIKHWYADFSCQTYEQTINKGKYGNLIGISHSVEHIAYSFLALLIFHMFVMPVAASTIISIAIIEGIIHYHIDWVKVKFGTKNMQSSLFWNQFGLDQLAHQLTYLAMVYEIVK